MGRGRSFSALEVELILDNYDKTIIELEEIFIKNGYNRSRKSINRKIEKLRDEGIVGFRSQDTIKRSYRQRKKKDNRPVPTKLEDTASFDNGSGWGESVSFDSGSGWEDADLDDME